MGVQLTKDSIDIGIIVEDGERSLKFYRDLLGLEHTADTPMPGGGGTMHRLMCGTTMVKLVAYEDVPETKAAPGGLRGATGYRYWTMSISNLVEVLEACRSGGYKVVIDQREIRPGVTAGMVEDPEGNWVELLEGNV